MFRIQPDANPGNARSSWIEPGPRCKSRCRLYEAIDFWLHEMHVARRTNDPDRANYAAALYDHYCDELDRRDDFRAAREARRHERCRTALDRMYPAWEVISP